MFDLHLTSLYSDTSKSYRKFNSGSSKRHIRLPKRSNEIWVCSDLARIFWFWEDFIELPNLLGLVLVLHSLRCYCKVCEIYQHIKYSGYELIQNCDLHAIVRFVWTSKRIKCALNNCPKLQHVKYWLRPNMLLCVCMCAHLADFQS